MSDIPMITISQTDRVLNITLNRPDDLNPLCWQVLNELKTVLDGVLKDDTVGVVVIGAAGKAFSTGYDLREEHWSPATNCAVCTKLQVALLLLRRFFLSVEHSSGPILLHGPPLLGTSFPLPFFPFALLVPLRRLLHHHHL